MRVIAIIPFVVAIVLFCVFLIQISWNAVVPDVFRGMSAITYGQAFLLTLLSSLLIRSWSYGSRK